MKTTTPTALEMLSARQKSLARVEGILEKLVASRQKEEARLTDAQRRLTTIDDEIRQAMLEAGLPVEATAIATVPQSSKSVTSEVRKRDLPRGVLTLAIVDVLKTLKKGASIAKVVELVQEKTPSLSTVPDLTSKVRNLLSNSDYFSHVEGERGVFVLSGKKMGGTLFRRLREEAKAA